MTPRAVCVLVAVAFAAACSDAATSSPANVYSPAGAASCPPASSCAGCSACPACPSAPACPAPVECPTAPACPESTSYATEYALRAPFCRTSDGKTWGCETFEAKGEPAGNVTYSARSVSWSCVLRSPDPSAADGLGWGPRYTAPLPCGEGNACDVTVVATSGAIEHRAGVCLAQRALTVTQ